MNLEKALEETLEKEMGFLNIEEGMTFDKALKKLNIEDFSDRIFNSNSHGELFFLLDYLCIASSSNDMSWFRSVFLQIVKAAEEQWGRPESVFQHIPRLLQNYLEGLKAFLKE